GSYGSLDRLGDVMQFEVQEHLAVEGLGHRYGTRTLLDEQLKPYLEYPRGSGDQPSTCFREGQVGVVESKDEFVASGAALHGPRVLSQKRTIRLRRILLFTAWSRPFRPPRARVIQSLALSKPAAHRIARRTRWPRCGFGSRRRTPRG